ncbi:MAG: hypothetical protein CL450_07670 [Acidimicrobiaceae bacterium]|nr:hypothetical protein [Acidimicrobiaceae bacterium]|tara:strand:+ start:82 stop:774 length:693 start_codon:yes stop_codon:yes gene_type:complete
MSGGKRKKTAGGEVMERFYAHKNAPSDVCTFLSMKDIDKFVAAIHQRGVIIERFNGDGSIHHKIITQGKGYLVVVEERVTSIGFEAFEECTGLTSVTFPEGLTSIGVRAFRGCTGLTSVTFPVMLQIIEYRAFEGCTGLTLVNFSEAFTRIKAQAFLYCSGLTSVIFEQHNTSFEMFEEWFGCGSGAFAGCTRLASVDFSDGNSLRKIVEFSRDPAAVGRSRSKVMPVFF